MRTGFFDKLIRKKDIEIEKELKAHQPVTFQDRFQGLKKRSGIQTVRGYKPKPEVKEKIQMIANDVFGDSDNWLETSLDDRAKKFEFLTKCQKELDHVVTNMDLNSIKTVEDAVTYFKTEVRDTCAYEDLSKLNLPKNLHMNWEYSNVQLHSDLDKPEDEVFKQPVRELKYRRKYKAHINRELEVLQH